MTWFQFPEAHSSVIYLPYQIISPHPTLPSQTQRIPQARHFSTSITSDVASISNALNILSDTAEKTLSLHMLTVVRRMHVSCSSITVHALQYVMAEWWRIAWYPTAEYDFIQYTPWKLCTHSIFIYISIIFMYSPMYRHSGHMKIRNNHTEDKAETTWLHSRIHHSVSR